MRDVSEAAGLICAHLDESEEAVITYSWPDFYHLNDAQKLHQTRKDALQNELWDEHGLLLAYGDRVVLVSRDRHQNRVRTRQIDQSLASV